VGEWTRLKSSKVVTLFAGHWIGLTKESHKDVVIKRHFAARVTDKVSNEPGFEKNFNLPRARGSRPHPAGERKIYAKGYRGDCEKRIDSTDKICECKDCSESTDYDHNMSKAGPELLTTVTHRLSELLVQAGLWEGDKTEKLLDELCKLSLASMDIESRTISLDQKSPKIGSNVPYAEINSAGLLPSHPVKIQKPLMIAHTDGILRERSKKLNQPATFC